jgi:hypothetical protein
MASDRPFQLTQDTFVPGQMPDSRSEELMNNGSGPGYLRSEMTLWQLRQRNIRSAGYGPELRWSVKCFIRAPQPLQAGAGTSSGLVDESGILDNRWQISRIASEQFETLSKISRHLR